MADARAYYNERDKHCAQWLRNLVAAGLVARGDVDDRDIRDVTPSDVAGYTQCHWFAGLGLWSLSLRWAGWPDDRPVWTGSCPCQPFSQAGRGAGFDDERHLWPAWHWLIRQCAPVALFGEQVSGPDGETWLDAVSADLEALRYACGALVVTSAGIGAPNIRHRLYWVASRLADTDSDGLRETRPDRSAIGCAAPERSEPTRGMADTTRSGLDGSVRCGGEARRGSGSSNGSGLDDTESGGRGEHGLQCEASRERESAGQSALADEVAGRMGDADPSGRARIAGQEETLGAHAASELGGMVDAGKPRLSHTEPLDIRGARRRSEGRAIAEPSRPPNPWSEPEWVACTDGRLRPFESGSFPLAPRNPGDVALLRAYGNAINPHVAAEVIAAWLECEGS